MLGCYKLLGVGIFCSCSCTYRIGHSVPVISNKTNVVLCSATFYLHINGKCYAFKDWSFENGLLCTFQPVGQYS